MGLFGNKDKKKKVKMDPEVKAALKSFKKETTAAMKQMRKNIDAVHAYEAQLRKKIAELDEEDRKISERSGLPRWLPTDTQEDIDRKMWTVYGYRWFPVHDMFQENKHGANRSLDEIRDIANAYSNEELKEKYGHRLTEDSKNKLLEEGYDEECFFY